MALVMDVVASIVNNTPHPPFFSFFFLIPPSAHRAMLRGRDEGVTGSFISGFTEVQSKKKD